MVINIFIGQTVLNIYLDEKKIEILTKANTLSNNIKLYLFTDRVLEFDEYFNRYITAYSKNIGSRVIITNKYKVVLADSNNEYIGKVLKHKEIQSSLAGKTDFGVYNFREYGHVLYTSVPVLIDNKTEGVILISDSLNLIYEKTNQISYSLMIISVISIFFIAILAFFFANFLTKPIKKFIEIINRISYNQLNQRVKINTKDEFKIMGNAFNLMISKLNQVDNQRKDFVANVSHELRTPLSSIKLLSQSLIHQNEKDINIYKEFLSDITSEVDRLNNIIDDLLIHVDLDKEKLNLNLKTTSINFILKKIVSRMTVLAVKKNIYLNMIFRNSIEIKVDSNKIQQAIINVIDNAIKYTPQYGKVLVELYEKNNLAVIKVKDNGIGISKDSLEHIFDRFYRVDKSRSRNTGGTGLGLSIAYQIVLLHQGSIEVESKVGEGSTFYVKIPKNLN